MVESTINKALNDLFFQWKGTSPEKIIKLPGAGSERKFYRIFGEGETVISVVGENVRENDAFIYLCRHFKSKGIAIPEVLAIDDTHNIYLLNDLGDTSLFSLVASRPDSKNISQDLNNLYRQVMEDLVCFQIEGHKNLDYSKCYPVPSFDRQSMQWDLNYFKYYGLKTQAIKFDEDLLEKDFQKLMDYLEEADSGFFMFRDFQSRNIFIHTKKPWYIDFQGGRRGPLQYDVVSLLFQAKADLPDEFREEMLNHYLTELSKVYSFDKETFISYYHAFVLLRTLQVLGAYGFRGRIEQKLHFLASIPYAIKNLQWFLNQPKLPIEIPELYAIMNQLIEPKEKNIATSLLVEINSFSYLKYGYPKDVSGNGGGFVFDCRALPNPGRYDEYKKITGKDKAVIDFLEKRNEVSDFLNHTFSLVDQAVENYLERGFNHLVVSFGCTGGQHRSVYSAEQLFNHLKAKYPVQLKLTHRMLDL